MNDPVDVWRPTGAALPLVLDSPHSGHEYPSDFRAAVEQESLRDLEDAHVDRLIADAPGHGATVVVARFPRAYIDPNRGEQDIDTTMLSGPWPSTVAPSPKTELGVGLVFRRTLDGRDIYAEPMAPETLAHRIENYYRPYHAALADALDEAHRRFGRVWHINCHSMPSVAGVGVRTMGGRRPDFCVGDRHGRSADRRIVERVVDTLRECGYEVTLNDPYPGVELLRRYADPANERHSVQVEVNRALYMHERTRALHAGHERIRAVLSHLVAELARDLVALSPGNTG